MTQTVSVILPVYNAEKYLQESLDSILMQTLQPYEIIVIDDGSTDNSLQLLERLGSKIILISRENRGLAATLNQAIQLAQGEFIAFLDADDLWVPNKLEQQVDFLYRHTDQEACFGMMQQFISPELPDFIKSTIYCPTIIQNGIMKITLMIRRTAFDRVGWFNEMLQRGDFVDWFARAEEVALRYTVLPELLTFRRLHRNSLSSQHQHEKDLIKVAKAVLDRRRATGSFRHLPNLK